MQLQNQMVSEPNQVVTESSGMKQSNNIDFLGHISEKDKSPQEIQIDVPNMEPEEPVQKINIAKVKWNQDFLKQNQ